MGTLGAKHITNVGGQITHMGHADLFVVEIRRELMLTTLLRVFGLSCLLAFSSAVVAGSANIELKCQSASGRTMVSGSVPGDSLDYNLRIQIDGRTLRYADGCADLHCNRRLQGGKLYVVEAIKQRVFAIAFVGSASLAAGSFYALPNTVRYQKTANGYQARYQAIYYGADPRQPNQLVKAPIQLTCQQQYEI